MTSLLETTAARGTAPGDDEHLITAMYSELRRVARALLDRERNAPSLQPTALVHEVYLRIFGRDGARFANERHFFAAAAEAMRRILVERARRRSRLKHGGGMRRVDPAAVDIPLDEPDVDLAALDDALATLERANPRAREIVNLRYFVGLTIAQTADALGTSHSTIEREWRFIKAWIQDALGD